MVVVVEYNLHIHMHTQQVQMCTDGADTQEQTRTHENTHSKDLKLTARRVCTHSIYSWCFTSGS